MEIVEATYEDKSFILTANANIDEVSFIETSKLKQNIDEDVFKNHKAVCLLAKEGKTNIGMVLFSKVYWADRGEGVYVSQIYVESAFRRQGIFKELLKAVYNFYDDTKFVTCLVAKKNENMINCMHNLGFEDEDMISYAKNKEDLLKILTF